MVQASQSGTPAVLVRKAGLKFLVLRVSLDRRALRMAFRRIQITEVAILPDYMQPLY
jgi:hypothetical protein